MRFVALSLAAALTAAATPALAATEAGPYVGVAVTHDNIGGTGDAEGFGINGVGGSVFVGYNLPLAPKVFAGVEANFDLASADADAIDIKADYAYGVSGRLGYRLSEGASVYGRVGYQRGRATIFNNTSSEFHEGADGLRLGAGVEANLTNRLALRVEYNHTHYYVDDSGLGLDVGLANNQAVAGLVFGF